MATHLGKILRRLQKAVRSAPWSSLLPILKRWFGGLAGLVPRRPHASSHGRLGGLPGYAPSRRASFSPGNDAPGVLPCTNTKGSPQAHTIRTLIITIGFLKGLYKGSIVGYYSIGALVIRIEFGGPLYHNYNKKPPK